MTNKVTMYEKSLEQIKGLVKGTNCTPREIKTGCSFFEGSDRFCKLVKTKEDMLYLEINVELPEAIEKKISSNNEAIFKKYSRIEASQKHLGSMVYLLKTKDEKLASFAIKESWNAFRSFIQGKNKQKEQKEEKNQKEKATK